MINNLINEIVGAIDDKKGKNIVSLDLSDFDGSICSAFIICNADSTTQVGAIADGIVERVEKNTGEKARRIEGMNNSIWVVVDYVDVMVHIFLTETRDFYKLEELWADAPIKYYNQNN